MKRFLIILSFTIVLFSSCEFEKTVDIGVIPISPHMVINGVIYANADTSYLYITESMAIYNEVENVWNPKFKIIKDADIEFRLNNAIQAIKYNDADTAYLSIGRINAGDKIKMTSYYDGKEISSTVEIPDAPQIISVDTTHIKRFQNYQLSNFILFNLKIKDNPNIKNYYRLIVENKLIESNSSYGYYDGAWPCYSDDPLLSGQFKVFRDVSFDGKEYNVKFYVNDNTSFFEERFDTKYAWYLYVKFQTINEDLYKYYSSLQANNQYDAESKLVYSNINGGLGILGACNQIDIFEYKISNISTR